MCHHQEEKTYVDLALLAKTGLYVLYAFYVFMIIVRCSEDSSPVMKNADRLQNCFRSRWALEIVIRF